MKPGPEVSALEGGRVQRGRRPPEHRASGAERTGASCAGSARNPL